MPRLRKMMGKAVRVGTGDGLEPAVVRRVNGVTFVDLRLTLSAHRHRSTTNNVLAPIAVVYNSGFDQRP
jgi:hypothetical protein